MDQGPCPIESPLEPGRDTAVSLQNSVAFALPNGCSVADQFADSAGGTGMAVNGEWRALNRQQQRVLIRLFGGGTLRNQDPEIVAGLRQVGLIEGERLSAAGQTLCEVTLKVIEREFA